MNSPIIEPVEDIAAAAERLFDQILLLPVRIQEPFECLIDRILRSVFPFPLHLLILASIFLNDYILS